MTTIKTKTNSVDKKKFYYVEFGDVVFASKGGKTMQEEKMELLEIIRDYASKLVYLENKVESEILDDFNQEQND